MSYGGTPGIGSTETGPDTIGFFFQVTGGTNEFVSFDMGLTDGDSIFDPSSVEFLGTPLPERNTALLIGLGLAGLASVGRRRNAAAADPSQWGSLHHGGHGSNQTLVYKQTICMREMGRDSDPGMAVVGGAPIFIPQDKAAPTLRRNDEDVRCP